MEKVKRQWSEAQTTLEELGIQLSVSKLQVSELQEKVHAKDTLALSGVGANSDPGGGGVWTPDNITSKCKGCNREFSFTRRKVNVFPYNSSKSSQIYNSYNRSIIAGIVVEYFATAVRNNKFPCPTTTAKLVSQFACATDVGTSSMPPETNRNASFSTGTMHLCLHYTI